jgi:hypothetical protein
LVVVPVPFETLPKVGALGAARNVLIEVGVVEAPFSHAIVEGPNEATKLFAEFAVSVNVKTIDWMVKLE